MADSGVDGVYAIIPKLFFETRYSLFKQLFLKNFFFLVKERTAFTFVADSLAMFFPLFFLHPPSESMSNFFF